MSSVLQEWSNDPLRIPPAEVDISATTMCHRADSMPEAFLFYYCIPSRFRVRVRWETRDSSDDTYPTIPPNFIYARQDCHTFGVKARLRAGF